jgi:hypothetical protein
MTISSTTVRNSYNGDGSTTTFSYTFKIFANSDLQVIIRNNTTATETVKTLTTHYTVTGVGSASGGSVIFTAGNIPASGETVVLRRAVPQTQAIDYIANDPFPAESHEEGLDRAMMTLQQVQEEVTRSIKLSRTNTMTSTEFTVGSSDRANKVLAFDSSGEIAITQEIGTFRGNWSTSVSYQQRDLIKDTTNNNIYIANTAHTSSGSLPISSNADSAKWNLIVDAASATASASAVTLLHQQLTLLIQLHPLLQPHRQLMLQILQHLLLVQHQLQRHKLVLLLHKHLMLVHLHLIQRHQKVMQLVLQAQQLRKLPMLLIVLQQRQLRQQQLRQVQIILMILILELKHQIHLQTMMVIH